MNRTTQMILVMMGCLATVAATDIFLPSLPSLAHYFGVSEDMVQLSIPVYMVGALFSAPILGTLSDRFGRRPIMIYGFTFFLIGSAWCIYAPTLNWFLAGRIVQGLGAVAPSVVGWALIQDLYPKDEGAKIMSWAGTVVCVGPFIAPGLGGYIHEAFGWRGNFLVLLILGAIPWILMVLSNINAPSPKSTAPQKTLLQNLKDYGIIFSDVPFLCYVSFFAILGYGEWTYLTIAPFYFENVLHLSPAVFGLYLSGSASCYILGTFTAPFLIRALGILKAIRFGIFAALLGGSILVGVSLLNPTNILWIAISFGFYFYGSAVVWGPSKSRAFQRFDDIRGSASAVRNLILQGAFAAGGMTGSLMGDYSLIPLSFVVLGTGICCLLVYRKVSREGL